MVDKSLLSFISFCVLRFLFLLLFTEHTSVALSLRNREQERRGAKSLSLLSESHILHAHVTYYDLHPKQLTMLAEKHLLRNNF